MDSTTNKQRFHKIERRYYESKLQIIRKTCRMQRKSFKGLSKAGAVAKSITGVCRKVTGDHGF